MDQKYPHRLSSWATCQLRSGHRQSRLRLDDRKVAPGRRAWSCLSR